MSPKLAIQSAYETWFSLGLGIIIFYFIRISAFADARGHQIERENYTSSLLQLLQQDEHPEKSPSTRAVDSVNEQNDWRRQCVGAKRCHDATEQRNEQRYDGQRYNGQRYDRERLNGQRYEGQRYNGQHYEQQQRGENWRQEQSDSWQRQRSYANSRRYDDPDESRYSKRQTRNDNTYAWPEETGRRRTSRPQQSWHYEQPEAELGYSRNHSSNRYNHFRENSRQNYGNNGNNFGNKTYKHGNNNNSTSGTSRNSHRFFRDEDN